MALRLSRNAWKSLKRTANSSSREKISRPRAPRSRDLSPAEREARASHRERFERLLEAQLRQIAPAFPFEREFAFAPGRKFRADFAFVLDRILVEIQGGIWRRGGGAHSRPANIIRDVEKAQIAARMGWRVFPVTTDEVRSGKAARLILELLETAPP